MKLPILNYYFPSPRVSGILIHLLALGARRRPQGTKVQPEAGLVIIRFILSILFGLKPGAKWKMEFLSYGKDGMVILAGYALGCFTTGYYLVRLCTGRDIRLIGSGSVGATNVSRILNRPGFILTLLLDLLKGALAVWLAHYFRLKPVGVVLAMVAVVMGHIWPVQLRLRGGKGVATYLGAVLMYDYFIALIFSGLFAAALILTQNFGPAGLLTFAVTPPVLLALGFPLTSVLGLSALTVLILIAHRKNIRAWVTKALAERKPKRTGEGVSK